MKKIFVMLSIVFVLSAVFIGCGKKEVISNQITKGSQANNNKVEQVDPNVTTGKNEEVKLDNNLKVKLNTFFSNFAEADLKFFEESKISDKDLLIFGAVNSAKNKNIETGYWGETQIQPKKVTQAHIQDSIKKHFNKTIDFTKTKTTDLDRLVYKDGYYLTSPGESEYDDFAIIDKLFDNGNNNFTAYVKVYNPYEDINLFNSLDIDYFAPYKNPDIDKEYSIISYKVKAKIHKEDDGRYVLLEYLEDK